MHTTDISKRNLFILSGEPSTIPLGELESLIETYSPKTKIQLSGNRVVFTDSVLDPNIITNRAAYVRFGGKCIDSMNFPLNGNFNKLNFAKIPAFKSFAARIYNFSDIKIKPDLEASLGKSVQEVFPLSKVSLKSPDLLVVGVVCDDKFHLCVVDPSSNRKSWVHRRPRSRPFFHPTALFPKFARLLVNLAHVKDDDILIDPFCGTGSIIIEAGIIGIRSIGFDVSRRMCRGALKNLKKFNISNSGITRADTVHPPLLNVDGVATDIPYGRASSTHKRRASDLADYFMGNLKDILPKGRYACIVHPQTINLQELGSFVKVQEHIVPVNRNLTRVITILKRV